MLNVSRLRNPFEGLETLGSRHYRHIHGVCRLPIGYCLIWLPTNAKLDSSAGQDSTTRTVCSSYNIPRAIIAIVQSVSGSITLYRARGDQIQRYGYVSFGLTVVPYVVMSVVNLCSTMLVPDYPTVYIVRSQESDEAVASGGTIDGSVGRVSQMGAAISPLDRSKPSLSQGRPRSSPPRPEALFDSQDKKIRGDNVEFYDAKYIVPTTSLAIEQLPWFDRTGVERWSSKTKTYTMPAMSFVVGAIPFAIIGLLSHYKPGGSTEAQRWWIMWWLVCTVNVGPFLELRWVGLARIRQKFTADILMIVAFMIYAPTAIGAFVVIAKMIKGYGSCTRIGG